MKTLERNATAAQKPSSKDHICNICGSIDFALVSDKDRDGEYMRTVICRDCGLVFTQDNRISDMKHFYTKEFRGTGSKPALKHVLRHGHNALKRYEVLKDYFKPGQSVFDVGCGSGEFIYMLSHLGLKTKGIEPHQKFSQYSRDNLGIAIENAFLDDFVANTDETYDMVTIFHVLEHMEDPYSTLVNLNKLLKPDGLCIVEVPNIDSYCHTPKNLFHINHLFNFNEKTLHLLGQKAGFVPIKTLFLRKEENVMVIFKKVASQSDVPLKAKDNYERVYKKLKGYTDFHHYCTPTPYVRLLKKYFQYRNERQYAAQFTDAKELLDTLYASHLKKK